MQVYSLWSLTVTLFDSNVKERMWHVNRSLGTLLGVKETWVLAQLMRWDALDRSPNLSKPQFLQAQNEKLFLILEVFNVTDHELL